MEALLLPAISRFTSPRVEGTGDGKDHTMNKRTIWLTILVAATALSLCSQQALALTETTVDMAGAGTFPPNTVYSGYPLSTLRYGVGVSVFSDGTATGDVDITCVGSQGTYTVEGHPTSGSVPKAGIVVFSGTSTVDMGNGTVYTGVSFSVTADSTKQTLKIVIGTATLNIATGTKGKITIK